MDYISILQTIVETFEERYEFTKSETKVFAESLLSGDDRETLGLKLGISGATAYFHLKNIYKKMDVKGMKFVYREVIEEQHRIIITQSMEQEGS